MTKLSEIDWNLLKFEFEVLGYTLEEIQETYEITPSVMAYQARNWAQAPAAAKSNLKFSDLSSLEALSDEVAKQVKEESLTRQLIKQKHLLPKYIQLENILLDKSIQFATSLAQDKPGSVNAIRTLTKVLLGLLEQNPMLAPALQDVEDNVEESREWKVTFVDATTPDAGEAGTVSDEEKAV